MSGGYRTGQPPTDLAGLLSELDDIRRRLDTLERPSGEQLAQVVEELQAWVADIQAQLDDYLANDAYTKAQVDNLVANPGNINPASINGSGNLTMAGEVRLPNVPVTILSTAYFATYGSTNDGGRIGHVPSSRKYKRDEKPVELDIDAVLALRLKSFRYIAAVEELGDEADVEVGLMAEDVAELGLGWLVYRDVDGNVSGIRYERLALALLPIVQAQAIMLDTFDARIAALEASSRR